MGIFKKNNSLPTENYKPKTNYLKKIIYERCNCIIDICYDIALLDIEFQNKQQYTEFVLEKLKEKEHC